MQIHSRTRDATRYHEGVQNKSTERQVENCTVYQNKMRNNYLCKRLKYGQTMRNYPCLAASAAFIVRQKPLQTPAGVALAPLGSEAAIAALAAAVMRIVIMRTTPGAKLAAEHSRS